MTKHKPDSEIYSQFMGTYRFASGDLDRDRRFFDAQEELLRQTLDGSLSDVSRTLSSLALDYGDFLSTNGRSSIYGSVLSRQNNENELYHASSIKRLAEGRVDEPEIQSRRDILTQNTLRLEEAGFDEAKAKELFPSGSWLLHSTDTTNIAGILARGRIRTTADFLSQSPSGIMRSKGGSLGVSWNFNRVDVLLGTPRHLAGFMADPEQLLESQGGMLAIPSKSCFNEIQYYGGTPEDIDEIRSTELQYNMAFSIVNTFAAGLAEDSDISQNIMMRNFKRSFARLKERLAEGQVDSGNLRRFYINGGQGMKFASHAAEQEDSLIPLLTFLQASADGALGEDIAQAMDYKLPTRINFKNLGIIQTALMRFDQVTGKAMKELTERVGPQSNVDIENTVFYCPDRDYDNWLEALARCKRIPRGIVVYDGKLVKKPSEFLDPFESPSKKDLTRQLGKLFLPAAVQWEDLFEATTVEASSGGPYLVNQTQTTSANVLVFDNKKLTVIDYDNID